MIAKSIGTIGNPYFFIKYASNPKQNITPVSKKVL